jgi:hypothetical protein
MKPLLSFKSHIDGKNADVAIYTDRIEWSKSGVLGTGGKLALGAATGGLSLLKTGVSGNKSKGSEVIPVKAISSVTTKKDGLRFTSVAVICSGNAIDFRVSHGEAAGVKDLLAQLMLGTHPSQQASPIPSPSPTAQTDAPAASVAEELKKLAELRDSGVLTDEEFAAQKAKLLG